MLLAVLLPACGSGNPEPGQAEAASTSSGDEETSERSDELAVIGLRGTLSQHEIQNALEPRMPKFSRCVQKRSDAVEWVSGKVEFQFHVALDGSVGSVFPSVSSMGDRETERCMLDVASSTKFPAPHGGEADFSWSLEVPLDPEIRGPVAWPATEADAVLAEQSEPLKAQCGPGPYTITAYVDTEGKVVAAGAATSEPAQANQLDCVSQAVQNWIFASPGSYAAKITFNLE